VGSGAVQPDRGHRGQWSAASVLSNDYLAIDSRLDRIRLQVELALAPPDLPRLSQRRPAMPDAGDDPD